MGVHEIPEFVDSSQIQMLPAQWGFTAVYKEPDDGGPRCSMMHVCRGRQLPMVRFWARDESILRSSVMFCVAGSGYIVTPPPDFDAERDGAHQLVPLAVSAQDMMTIEAGIWHRIVAGDSDLVFFITDYGWQFGSVEEMDIAAGVFGLPKDQQHG